MFKLKKNLFSKAEHNVNRLILVLGIFLLTITAIVMAQGKGWISLNLGVISTLKTISIILWTYFIATVFIRLTQAQVFKLFDESVDVEQKLLLSKLYISFIYVISTAFVLWKMGVTLSNITLFLGLAATGIAFAIREVILSYIVWFMLLTKKPFRIGDYIKMGEEEGIVKHIGTFFVFIDPINTEIKETIKIPNKLFLEKQVITYGGINIPVIVKAPVTSVELINVEEKIKFIKKDFAKIYPDYQINPKLISDKEYVYLFFDFTVPHTENLTMIRHRCYEETYMYFKGAR
ncbi:MAG: mechanosensitive ion channel domain-containing protein [archaeon]|jgi:small-conductance mechanosensitive channel